VSQDSSQTTPRTDEQNLMLDPYLPFLEIHGPGGSLARKQLDNDRIMLGRLRQYNDVALEDDPQRLVTRIGHCAIERDAYGWWVVDNASQNRTYHKRGDKTEIVRGRSQLINHDEVHILARLPENRDEEAQYWVVKFNDPERTMKVSDLPSIAHLEYDWIEALLYRVDENGISAVDDLRPQEHVMIRFMDQKNRSNGYVAVMCTTDELIEAIWGDDGYDHTEADVTRLVYSLRRKIEGNPSDPQMLLTVRGLGYRLRTQPRPNDQVSA
jgi:hypothetical protein